MLPRSGSRDKLRFLLGAGPTYLSIIPALADPHRDERRFASIFILVIAAPIVQGWTVAPVARLLGFAAGGKRRPDVPCRITRR
jgi:NhaP-type Na+/H+ and K+/H+ antiporter